jgi:TrmH family RNA methyltransferase
LEQVLVAESLWQDTSARVQQLLADLQTAVPSLITIPNDTMSDLTDGRTLGGLLGLVALPSTPDLPQLVTTTANPLLLAAIEVVDPGNVGALLRTGHASGITAFVAVGRSDPFHPKAVRTGMGSLFKVPVVRIKHIKSLIAMLQAQDIKMVGTAVRDGIVLPQAQFLGRGTAVFMGNEYWGLPKTLQSQMDTLVTIPMAEGIDSFSVNAAAAIILYEIRRATLA